MGGRVPWTGLEPVAYRLGGGRSIHLSYQGGTWGVSREVGLRPTVDAGPLASAVADLVGEAADVAGRRGGAGRRQGRRRLGCCPGRGRGSGSGCGAGADVRPGAERGGATRRAEPGGAVEAGDAGAEVAAPARPGGARGDVEQRRRRACRWWRLGSRGRPGRRRLAMSGAARLVPPSCNHRRSARRCRRSTDPGDPARADTSAIGAVGGSQRRSASGLRLLGRAAASRLRTRPSRSSLGCWCPAPSSVPPTAVTPGGAGGHGGAVAAVTGGHRDRDPGVGEVAVEGVLAGELRPRPKLLEMAVGALGRGGVLGGVEVVASESSFASTQRDVAQRARGRDRVEVEGDLDAPAGVASRVACRRSRSG